MDPMTMMAIAQVGAGAVQSIWNYMSAQDQLGQRKKRLGEQYTQEKNRIDTQYAQGKEDIAQAAGSDAAGLAARGIEGAFSTMAVEGNKAGRTDRLNVWNAQAKENLDTNYKYGLEDLQSASDQVNMDTLMNGLGIGLSAGATLVDAGAFTKNNDWTDMFTGDSYKKRKKDLDLFNTRNTALWGAAY